MAILVNNGAIRMADVRKDFKLYLFYKWKWLGLPEPTELQYEIADWYQHGPDRKLIEAFRGIGKSWIVASYCEWMWLRERDYRMLILSGKKEKASELSGFIKSSIENFDLLRELKHPEQTGHKALWGVERFNIFGAPPDIAPSCKVASATSSIVGSRAHEIIPDDIETPQNSGTVEGREKLIAVFSEFENILFPNCNKVTVLGTPQSIESVYTHLVQEKGYTPRVWPGRVPSVDKESVYQGFLAPSIQERFDKGEHGLPTEPTRFSQTVLINKESRMVPGAFTLQFMLDTSMSDADKYPLKLKDLIIMDLDKSKAPTTITWATTRETRIKELPMVGFSGDRFHSPFHVDKMWEPYNRKTMFIDPSGRGKDETAYAIGGDLHGRIFCLDFGGYKDGYSEETLIELLKKAKKNEVSKIIYEDNFGDGMFGKLLENTAKKIYPVSIEGVRSKGNKEIRMVSTLEPVIRQHRLIFDMSSVIADTKLVKEGVNSSYSLMYQLTHLMAVKGCLKHDDRLDALALMCEYFSKALGINVEQALEEYNQKQKEEDFAWFMKDSICFPLSGGKAQAMAQVSLQVKKPVFSSVHPRQGTNFTLPNRYKLKFKQ